jgi:tRNA 2-selenouridine synthase
MFTVVATTMQPTNIAKLVAMPTALVIDVRSEGEYAYAHIPGAKNLPIFNNEERALIGTTYKKQSRQKAIKIGLEYFGKNLNQYIQKVEQWKQETSAPIIVHCWRGGMRSAAMVWLLQFYGIEVSVLQGGYKSFRNWAIEQFEKKYELKVLGGFTGSNKTKLLQQMAAKGTAILDLEGIASHKGSAFGHIGLPEQPSQEQFENNLALALLHLTQKTFWVEDESWRIGKVKIPDAFWHTMRQQKIQFVQVDFATRLQNIIEDYGSLPKGDLQAAILKIEKRLGGLATKEAIAFLENNNIEKCFAILLAYYDKTYTVATERRGKWEEWVVPCRVEDLLG